MNEPRDTIISIDNPKYSQAKDSQKAEINILCLDITPYSRLTQILLSIAFVFICYLAYGYFIEFLFLNPSAKSVGLYITMVQFLITAILAYVESLIRVQIQRKVPLRTYAIIAAMTLGTMTFSNLSLIYLNYPTQLIFKSCKLLPVMIGSIIIMKKKYGFLDYAAAVTMCIGLTMFTLANARSSPKFDFIGVVVISLALICDAVIGNVQEKAMKQYSASNNEIVFYSYAIASIYLFIITLVSGAMSAGISYSNVDPIRMYVSIFFLSLFGYMGLQAVLTLVRICDATVAVTVTTMRKAVSIIFSFLMFSKPFTFQYVWSGMLVVFAIYLNHISKRHPHYVPKPVLWLLEGARSMYDYEHRTSLKPESMAMDFNDANQTMGPILSVVV